MKKFNVNLFCFVCTVFLSGGSAQAQWVPNGRPEWDQFEISTVGGITYFQGVSGMNQWCSRLAGYPVYREGTNLSLFIQQEVWSGICACDEIECGPVPVQGIAAVLGALGPDDYSLTIWSSNRIGYSPRLFSFFRTFTVPADGMPALAIARGSGESVQIQVAGIANIQYVLQGSMDLTNWTSLRTNIGAPTTFVRSNAVPRFYRTAILPIPPSP